MKWLIFVITGAMLAATSALAGSTSFEAINRCVHGPNSLASCLQQHQALPEARAKKIAACLLRRGSNGKSVTRKQWLGCGLPKEDLKV
jgi:hypothetical protein